MESHKDLCRFVSSFLSFLSFLSSLSFASLSFASLSFASFSFASLSFASLSFFLLPVTDRKLFASETITCVLVTTIRASIVSLGTGSHVIAHITVLACWVSQHVHGFLRKTLSEPS